MYVLFRFVLLKSRNVVTPLKKKTCPNLVLYGIVAALRLGTYFASNLAAIHLLKSGTGQGIKGMRQPLKSSHARIRNLKR